MERFRFNPETLSYQKVEYPGKQKVLRLMAFVGLVLTISFGILYLRDTQMQTLRAENLKAKQQQIIYELSLMNRDMEHYGQKLDQVAFNDDHIYRVYF